MKKELMSLLKLGIPMFIAHLVQTGNSVIDTIMAGDYSTEALAAIGLGSALWVPFFLFMATMLHVTSAMVASKHAKGEDDQIAFLTQQNLYLGIPVAVFSILIVNMVLPLFLSEKINPDLKQSAMDYVLMVSMGFPACVIFFVLKHTLEGLHIVRPMVYFSLLTTLLNIPLNYVFMYGKFGFPEMGSFGIGLATTLVMWTNALMLLVYCYCHKALQKYNLFKWTKVSVIHCKDLVKQGVPAAIAVTLEILIIAAYAIAISSYGVYEIGAHQIMMNLISITFGLPLCLALALNVRVGFHLGKQNAVAFKQCIQAAYVFILSCAVCSALIVWNLQSTILDIYTEDQRIQAVAYVLLPWLCLTIIMDGLQITSSLTLRAMKRTFNVMLTAIVSWSLACILAFTLAETNWIVEPMEAEGFWVGIFASVLLFGSLLTIQVVYYAKRLIQQMP